MAQCLNRESSVGGLEHPYWGKQVTISAADGGAIEGDLYWLVIWDSQCHHVAPHHAEKRQTAVRHGLEHVPDMTLLAVINDGPQSPEAFQHRHFQVVQAPPRSGHPTYRGTACRAPVIPS